MKRRQALTLLGTSIGALAGAGLYGRYVLLPPSPSEQLDSLQSLSIRLYDSMSPALRSRACVEYDHPLRQFHNRGVRGGGVGISSGSFSREQRGVLTDILYAGLSEQGRRRVPEEYFTRWTGVQMMNLLICGDPRTTAHQVILTGPHLNLRLGGMSREGVAFGGPQVYGDQRGNYLRGLPGNLYRYQFEIGQKIFAGLEAGQKRGALLPRAPVQTQIELQGRDAQLPGVAVAALSKDSKSGVTDLIDGILSTYDPVDVADARRCLDENGGIDSLHLSYYEDGEVDRSGAYQIFRLEGPSAVFHFRGYPHVHAFINIAMNGDEPLSVGEVVGQNPAVMEGLQVRQLFEDVMKERAGTDFAYYDPDGVVGRLRKGLIRAGDIYNLESWQDAITVVEMKGSAIKGAVLDHPRRLGVDPEPARVYSVAMVGQVGADMPQAMPGEGGVDAMETPRSGGRGVLLRDATIAYLKKQWSRPS